MFESIAKRVVRLAGRVESKIPRRLRPLFIWVYDRSRSGLRTISNLRLLARIRSVGPTRIKLPAQREPLTVVVPCYNEERFIAECLKSLKKQSYSDWRCIVVDDASTDNSVAIATQFAASDSRITVVRHKKNSGLSASRNTGLRLADTSLITFLDADDFLLVDSLSDRVATIDTFDNPELVGVYCGSIRADENATLKSYPSKLTWEPADFEDFLSTKGDCPFVAHTPLLKTEILRRAGGFDESMKHGAEDWDLWLRLMRNGYLFKSSAYRTAVYRMKRSSMVRSMPLDHLKEAQRLLASADSPLRPNHIIEKSAAVFDQPISQYELGIRQNLRILQFCGMAAEKGEGSMEEVIELLDAPSWQLLNRHHDITRSVDQGIMRAMCLSASGFESKRSVIIPIREEILSKAEAWVAKTSQSTNAPPKEHIDLLFAPATAVQFKAMQKVVDALSDEPNVRWVNLDREDGNQGTETALDSAGVQWLSLNDLLLGSYSWGVVVLTPDHGQAVAGLVATANELIFNVDDEPQAFAREIGKSRNPAVKNQVSDLPADISHTKEEYPATRFDGSAMNTYSNRHAGERCFIIGNGPSLNDLNLKLLADQTTFAVNGIFYAQEKMGFDPTYYVVEDSSVMKENLAAIKSYRAGHKFFPSIYRKLYGEEDGATFFMMNRGFYETSSANYCKPRFSYDAAQRLYCGQSVTHINLQLAYYMGFTEVILIGMDFSYEIPDSAKREGDLLTSSEADPNHFHPDYFGKGKTWKDPKLDRVFANYELAKATYEHDGRRIINATAGGKLELFERVQYESLFASGDQPRLSPPTTGR